MKLVKMVRSSPEIPGGPTSCKVQLQDIEALKARGYVQEGEEFEIEDPANDEPKAPEGNNDPDTNTEKAALVAKAQALKASNPKAVKASPSAIPNMSVEKLTALIAEAEALKASNPKAVKASPSAIPNMSVEKLTALVAKAEALKASNPKAVKASPSAIPNMSVEKLTALIAEAEAIIAAGNQD